MRYPPGFPRALHPPVDAALAKAEVAFRKGVGATERDDYRALQGLALAFMQSVVGTFGRQASEAVSRGVWTGEDLRRSVDVFEQESMVYVSALLDDPSSTELDTPFWLQIRKEFRQSEEWLTHLDERVTVHTGQWASTAASSEGVDLETEEGRRALVRAYIREESKATGKRVTRKSIAEQVGYADPSSLQRWQRCDKRTSKRAHEKFTAVLTQKHHAE